MRVAARSLLLLVLTVVASACYSSRQTGPLPPAGSDTTPLRVQNQSWLQMNVYVVAGGGRVRLGTVSGNSTTTLQIPRHVVGQGREVSFYVDPVGSSQTATSFEMWVRPGERVTITIPPTLR